MYFLLKVFYYLKVFFAKIYKKIFFFLYFERNAPDLELFKQFDNEILLKRQWQITLDMKYIIRTIAIKQYNENSHSIATE